MNNSLSANFRNILAPGPTPPSIAAPKIDLLKSRIRLCCLITAVLILAWAPVDFLCIPASFLNQVLLARLITAFMLSLVFLLTEKMASIYIADVLLGLMLAICLVFFAYTNILFAEFPQAATNVYIKTAYADLPLLLASLICFFPLSIIECIIFSAEIIFGTLLVAALPNAPANAMLKEGTLLLLIVICLLASIGAGNLLYYIWRLIDSNTHDQMTGCLKRDHGELFLDNLYESFRRQNLPLTVVFLDLDNFKSVNDMYGHSHGDNVLTHAGRALHRILRKQDIIIRWGGEEFLIVLPNSTPAHVQEILRRLDADGIGYRPDGAKQTASCGCAEYMTDKCANIRELVTLADNRMYQAKKAGKNCVMSGNTAFPFVAADR